ncbi:MAG: hypothetical protein ABI597_11915 [Gammaproteobacteria bacterium]
MALNDRWHKIIGKTMEYSDIVRRWFVVNSDSPQAQFLHAAGQAAMSILFIRNIVRGINSIWRIYDAYLTKESCDFHVKSADEWNKWSALIKGDKRKKDIRDSYVLVQNDDPEKSLSIFHIDTNGEPGEELIVASHKRQKFEESFAKIMGKQSSKSLSGQEAFDLITDATGHKVHTRLRNIKIVAATLTLVVCTTATIVAAIGLLPIVAVLAAASQLVSAARELWNIGEVIHSWRVGKWSKDREIKNASETSRRDLLNKIAASDREQYGLTGKNPQTLSLYLSALDKARHITALKSELLAHQKISAGINAELEQTLNNYQLFLAKQSSEINDLTLQYEELLFSNPDAAETIKRQLIKVQEDTTQTKFTKSIDTLKETLNLRNTQERDSAKIITDEQESFTLFTAHHPALEHETLQKLINVDRTATTARNNQLKQKSEFAARLNSLAINLSYAIALTLLLTPLAPIGGILLLATTIYHTIYILKSSTRFRETLIKTNQLPDSLDDFRKTAEGETAEPIPSPKISAEKTSVWTKLMTSFFGTKSSVDQNQLSTTPDETESLLPKQHEDSALDTSAQQISAQHFMRGHSSEAHILHELGRNDNNDNSEKNVEYEKLIRSEHEHCFKEQNR